MRFVRPFEDLIRGGTSIRVLRALLRSPSREFTGRGLAREAHADPSKTIRELHRFEALGLVERRGVGRADCWRILDHHYLARALAPAFESERKARLALEDEIRRAFGADRDVRRVLLFGSVARGDETPESDVDVLVVVKDAAAKKRARKAAWDLQRRGFDSFGNPIQTMIFTEARWRRSRQRSFARNAIREGIVLLDREASEPEKSSTRAGGRVRKKGARLRPGHGTRPARR